MGSVQRGSLGSFEVYFTSPRHLCVFTKLQPHRLFNSPRRSAGAVVIGAIHYV